MRDRYGARSPRSTQLRFHTQTAGVSLTAQQPEVNIVRTAIEALAGVLGGTQSLHTNSMDEVLALPTERAARIALRTQQVIAHETGVANVADPLGGSWFVEDLTDEMERQAESVFAYLGELGDGSMLEGVYVGIDRGYFQDEIAQAAYEFECKVSSGRRIVVGVNALKEGNEEDPPLTLRVGQEVEDIQLKRLGEVRQSRSPDAVEVALSLVREDARDPTRNLMDSIGQAVRAYATGGEIMGALAAVFGRWQEVPRT
jgi:methylmalonyl-CoA mutase, N-terminal domain